MFPEQILSREAHRKTKEVISHWKDVFVILFTKTQGFVYFNKKFKKTVAEFNINESYEKS